VTKIAFSADNRFVATGSTFHYPYQVASEENNSLRVFLLRPQDLIDEGAARIKSLSQIVRIALGDIGNLTLHRAVSAKRWASPDKTLTHL
jgi:hypothetical protein